MSAVAAGALLKVEHLEVRYGELIGVADISLQVQPGAIVALLGSNGAGKTTTLNAIAGLVPVARGAVQWCGEDIAGQPAHAIVRKGLALSPEGWRLFTAQSVEQNLRLGATPLANQRRIPSCWSGCTPCSPASRSGTGSAPAPFRAGSGRCWRSGAR